MNDVTNLTELNMLNEMFPDPTGIQFNRNFKDRKLITYTYIFKGRKAYIEREDSHWIGWFDDDHSMEYLGQTRKEVVRDMQ